MRKVAIQQNEQNFSHILLLIDKEYVKSKKNKNCLIFSAYIRANCSLCILVAMSVIQLICSLLSIQFDFIPVATLLIWVIGINLYASVHLYKKFQV